MPYFLKKFLGDSPYPYPPPLNVRGGGNREAKIFGGGKIHSCAPRGIAAGRALGMRRGYYMRGAGAE